MGCIPLKWTDKEEPLAFCKMKTSGFLILFFSPLRPVKAGKPWKWYMDIFKKKAQLHTLTAFKINCIKKEPASGSFFALN